MTSVGQQIYLKRQDCGLTQAAHARKTGIPQPNLSNIEKGQQDLTVTTLKKIASALNVPAASFFQDPGPEEKLRLSRPVMERLAHAIARGGGRLSPREKEIADFFRNIMTGQAANKIRIKKLYPSWLELKRRFSSSEIQAIIERVRALQKDQP